jgi:hypothetical protein
MVRRDKDLPGGFRGFASWPPLIAEQISRVFPLAKQGLVKFLQISALLSQPFLDETLSNLPLFNCTLRGRDK